jgi:membrane-bound metal-dependent hydrolase YbcI (DUF457 family)
MLAGHIGVGLAIGRWERRVNVAVFVAAALLLDLLLWLFILLGWESVRIPADFLSTHQPEFVFPYSHSLLAALFWSVAAGLVVRFAYPRARAGWPMLVAVFSHWLLDALVHRAELPLAGGATPQVGLALWDHMPVALVIETAIVVLGLFAFVRGSKLARGRAIGLVALNLGILALTAVGMTVAPAPPSALAMAGSSLLTLAVICGALAWLGKAEV